MQFDRSSSQQTSSVPVPRDSFLPLVRIDDSNREDVKGKWSNVNGRWSIVPIELAADKISPVKPSIQKAEPVCHTSTTPKTVLVEEKTLKETAPRSKTGTTKPQAEVKFISSKYYRHWESGRNKKYLEPDDNVVNTAAAVKLQKMMRGWWQKLQVRVKLLQHKLATAEDTTAHELSAVAKKLQARKTKHLSKMKAKAKVESNQIALEALAAQESKEVIDYLRKENKKLRSSNEKIAKKIKELKQVNNTLALTGESIAASFKELVEHTEHLKETRDQIEAVIPQYEKSINQLQSALDVRHQYCLSEQSIRVSYVKCVGRVVEAIQENCKQTDLVNEVEEYCMETADRSLQVQE